MGTFRFGVSAAHGSAVEGGARALADFLGRRTGMASETVVAGSYADLTERLTAGALDAAWLPPLAVLQARRHGAVLAAVCERNGRPVYRSAILIDEKKVAPVGRLNALRAAWTDPLSAAGHVVPRAELRGAHRAPDTLFASERFAGSPAAAATLVRDGEADLCAAAVSAAVTAFDALSQVESRVGPCPGLVVLLLTRSIPADGIVVRSDAPADLTLNLGEALLVAHEDAAGRTALAEAFQAERFVAAGKVGLAYADLDDLLTTSA